MSDRTASSSDGQVVLITGGGRGIGRAVAELLIARGARVGILERDADALSLFRGRDDILPIEGDAGVREDMLTAAQAVRDRYGRLSGIVTNAVAARYGPVDELRDADLDALFAVGIKQVVWAAQAAPLSDSPAAECAIVNLVSPVAMVGVPYTAAYTAAKGAVAALTRQLATELGPAIRVNAVLPGSIETEGAASVGEADRHVRRTAVTPLRRRGRAEEVASAIAFLLSHEARFITGTILAVDGGITVAGH